MGCVMKMFRDWQVSERKEDCNRVIFLSICSYPVMMIF